MSSLTFISGRIGTVESKTLDSGIQVTKFSVASDEREKVNGEWERVAEWYNCIMWGNENLIKFLKKGAIISFVARKKDSKWETEDGEKRSRSEFIFDKIMSFPYLESKDEEVKTNGWN